MFSYKKKYKKYKMKYLDIKGGDKFPIGELPPVLKSLTLYNVGKKCTDTIRFCGAEGLGSDICDNLYYEGLNE